MNDLEPLAARRLARAGACPSYAGRLAAAPESQRRLLGLYLRHCLSG